MIAKTIENEENKVKSEKENMILTTDKLSVGYDRKIVVDDISIDIRAGEIVTMIGPNGSGKSTVLKTIIGQLQAVSGSVCVCNSDLKSLKNSDIAKEMSILMTERIHPNLMTVREVIESGRYPYTNRLGKLSLKDMAAVDEAIELTHSKEIEDKDFNRISDGQKQRVMLARAICQDTRIIVLDEPTTFLDIYYKLDLIKCIRKLAREKNKTIIMSLHELDLAKLISDRIICIDDKRLVRFDSSEKVFEGDFIERLYGLEKGTFDPKTCQLRI